jgi:aminoglycoside/choline kinase family phosphotransferase
MEHAFMQTAVNDRAKKLEDFAKAHCGADVAFQPLVADASFRRYVRLTKGNQCWMLMDAPPPKEDVGPYLSIAKALFSKGYSAPKIVAQDADQGFLILEDLGDETFTRVLKKEPEREASLYKEAIELLAEWHTSQVINRTTVALPEYDTALLMREVELFSNWFLPQILDAKDVEKARTEYRALWKKLLTEAKLSTKYFVHRDYHADNLMWLPNRSGAGKVGLLDFQDGVYGDPAYDMVSLLEDARRDVPQQLVDAMLLHYRKMTGATEQFDAAYALLAAQRNLKIVGIFTRLAARDGKHHYLNLLPRVWGHVMHDIEHPTLAALKQWMARTVPSQARGAIVIKHDAKALGLAA